MLYNVLCAVWQLIGIIAGILLLAGFIQAIVEHIIGGRKDGNERT